MNFLLIFSSALMMMMLVMMQPGLTHSLRMKRSQNNSESDSSGSTASATDAPLSGKATVVFARTNGTTTGITSTTSSKQKITAGPKQTTVVNVKTTDACTTTTTTSSSAPVKSTSSPLDAGKIQLVEDLMGLRRPKRRMGGLMDENVQPRQLHHKRRQGGEVVAATTTTPQPVNPYVYYNKLVSPDGKHELKEFELLAPNMMIESVQQELNFGPDVLPPELAEVLLLNAAENTPRGVHNSGPLSKHHHKHKSSPALPPMLYMLQQLLQQQQQQLSPFEGSILVEPLKEPKEPQHRVSSPLYQFLDGAMDLALRNNPDVIEHLLGDHLELELELGKNKQKGSKDKGLTKKAKKDSQKMELFAPKDELIVSCPIHHEHHANRNGEIVEDDMVMVNECHLI
ncbi:uncharacterized protein LOC108095251 [Drosophila ficusphila]|uniref:uncharacterized protein LOC108095251 n=1 Tax=Drosophila ficusphila TaxID=30025 RepID=UPI0007E62C4B|nr:uncharacterized protein LOC108095251 [Drosophila ficusphila]